MAVIKINAFKGIVPKVGPELLNNSAAVDAKDVDLSSGQLQPWPKPLGVAGLAGGAGVRTTAFWYNNSVWLTWGIFYLDGGESQPFGVSVCLGPETTDPPNVYFTLWEETIDPTTPPRKTNLAICGTTAQRAPIASKYLGVTSPGEAPYTSVLGTPSSSDPLLIDSRAYVYTFVNDEGEEGPPSPPSVVNNVAPGQTVLVNTMIWNGSPYRTYTSKRIYRTNTGTSGTQYQFVAEIPIAQANYTDAIASSALGEVIPSTDWYPPITGLQGIICLPNGSLAAFKGKTVYFSVPYVPHAWPDSYSITVDYKIVALGAFGSVVLVVTEGIPYLVNATDPSNLVSERMETGQACLSRRSLVDMGTSIIYAGTDGLIEIGQGVVRNLTADIMTPTQWRARQPSLMHSYLWNEKYVCFIGPKYQESLGAFTATYGGFIFDPATGVLTDITQSATAGYRDPKSGDLYIVDGTYHDLLLKWAGTDGSVWSNRFWMTWTSKQFRLEKPTSFAWGQVQLDTAPSGYPAYATVKVTINPINGGAVYTRYVDATAGPFRLPPGMVSDLWQVTVEGFFGVRCVLLADTIEELKNA